MRFVLAVVRAGSVSAAGKALGVNHATVLRRVASFEENHGIELFDKTVRGYRVMPGRQPILDALVAAEDAFLGISRAVTGAQAPVSGLVRVTSTDTFCQSVLPNIVGDIRAHSADIQIELISSNMHLDLGRLDADLTVRPTNVLPDDMVGVKAAELGFAVYRQRGSATDFWLGPTGALGRAGPANWLVDHVQDRWVVAKSDSFVTLRELALAGVGQTFLPCILGDREQSLERVDTDAPAMSVPIWVAGHRDMSDIPRIREVRRLIASGLGNTADALAGR